jgi:D-beta-D-heptose 7-phosphate kinase / D-beta-D-heptose 1-phosphate adenosyltransferase
VTGADLLVVGDTLLDRDLDGTSERLSPEAPVPVVDNPVLTERAGGAGLAASLAARDGREVTLVTALAPDAAGRRLCRLLESDGIQVLDLGLVGRTPEKTRVRSNGQAVVRLDSGGDGSLERPAGREVLDAVGKAAGLLVSDYGRGVTTEGALRRALRRAALDAPVVWDPHPCGALPVEGSILATPNRSEAARFSPDIANDGLAAITARARALCQLWNVPSVAVTLGAGGALLVTGEAAPLVVPAPTVASGDSCGAGDRFAATAAGQLADGAGLSAAVTAAVGAATAFVSAGGASGHRTSAPPPIEEEDAYAVAARVRRSGGTVVATGGCFDLLHAGHVALLQATRSLGDCLVVCVNSDDSIRRLKGPDRPLVTQEDRTQVLEALGCVDATIVFEEDTPAETLRRLRPHVWAKGGDYEEDELPEADVVRAAGGDVVILPYVAGRSTSRLLEEVASRVAR